VSYPRDLRGYGRSPPHPRWPNGARIALQFVLNHEEGAENCVLDGDPTSETFLSEIVGAAAFPMRHMSMESLFEYGSRAGLWRVLRAFKECQVTPTVYAVGLALEPDAPGRAGFARQLPHLLREFVDGALLAAFPGEKQCSAHRQDDESENPYCDGRQDQRGPR